MLRCLGLLIIAATVVAAGQEFEVASVKRSPRPAEQSYRFSPPGYVTFIHTPLGEIIAHAYDIPLTALRRRLVGGARELLAAPMDMQAKGDPKGDPKVMLRRLLASRFGLTVHAETRDVPLYALTRKGSDRLGPSLKRSPYNCWELFLMGARFDAPDAPAPCRRTTAMRYGVGVQRSAGTIAELIDRVVQAPVREPVIDRTGLTGNYEWEIAFVHPPRPDAPSLFTAVEDQLGLKLERTVGPYGVLVIDAVHAPTPN